VIDGVRSIEPIPEFNAALNIDWALVVTRRGVELSDGTTLPLPFELAAAVTPLMVILFANVWVPSVNNDASMLTFQPAPLPLGSATVMGMVIIKDWFKPFKVSGATVVLAPDRAKVPPLISVPTRPPGPVAKALVDVAITIASNTNEPMPKLRKRCFNTLKSVDSFLACLCEPETYLGKRCTFYDVASKVFGLGEEAASTFILISFKYIGTFR
jgi:hypothetical protein